VELHLDLTLVREEGTVDTTTLLILGGIAIIVVVAVLFALSRSWGDFPSRAGVLPQDLNADRAQEPFSLKDLGLSDAELELERRRTAAPDASGGLVPIENPMVRRAAEQARQRGSPMAKYVVCQDDQLYFSFDAISDPVERQEAYKLMRQFHAGQNVDIRALVALINKLSKG
jgi:hypothetical protein